MVKSALIVEDPILEKAISHQCAPSLGERARNKCRIAAVVAPCREGSALVMMHMRVGEFCY